MNICLIQSGRLGDTIICLPIAKYYKDLGYNITWIIHYDYKDIFNYVDYIDHKVIIPSNIDFTTQSISWAYEYISDKIYDKVIDLSICFIGSKVNNYCNTNLLNNFVEVKYKIANVPIHYKWNLEFNRNYENEDSLYNLLNTDNEKYVLIHNSTSDDNIYFDIESPYKKIYFKPFYDYTIFDWYKVIENSEEIYCIDSSLSNFIDGVNYFNGKKRYFSQKRTDMTNRWLQPPLKNWILL